MESTFECNCGKKITVYGVDQAPESEVCDKINNLPVVDGEDYIPGNLNSSGNRALPDDSTAIPAEIRGWSWGAFLLGPVWCIGNGVFSGLFYLLPFGSLFMPFILGFKGNVWAWKCRRWTSVNQFKAYQRRWAVATAIIYIVLPIAFLLKLIFASLIQALIEL